MIRLLATEMRWIDLGMSADLHWGRRLSIRKEKQFHRLPSPYFMMWHTSNQNSLRAWKFRRPHQSWGSETKQEQEARESKSESGLFCIHCENPLHGKQKKFCSFQCSYRHNYFCKRIQEIYMPNKFPRVCIACGNQFQDHHNHTKYCSDICRKERQAAIAAQHRKSKHNQFERWKQSIDLMALDELLVIQTAVKAYGKDFEDYLLMTIRKLQGYQNER